MQSHEFIAIPVDAVARHLTPLYGEARERVRRLGAMNSEGVINLEAIITLSVPFAATLYANLLESGEEVHEITDTLAELCDNAEVTGMYLYLCVLYAQLGEIIPEPVQWISGEREVLFSFCEALIDHMTNYLHEDGFLSDEDDADSGKIFSITSAVSGTDCSQI